MREEAELPKAGTKAGRQTVRWGTPPPLPACLFRPYLGLLTEISLKETRLTSNKILLDVGSLSVLIKAMINEIYFRESITRCLQRSDTP